MSTPSDTAARLRAIGDLEAADTIERLLGINARNRSRYVELQAVCREQRDRLGRLSVEVLEAQARLTVFKAEAEARLARIDERQVEREAQIADLQSQVEGVLGRPLGTRRGDA